MVSVLIHNLVTLLTVTQQKKLYGEVFVKPRLSFRHPSSLFLLCTSRTKRLIKWVRTKDITNIRNFVVQKMMGILEF